MRRLLPLLLTLLIILPVHAQMDSLRMTEDFIHVGLVVAEPGEVLYSTLGHACLHIECETFGRDYILSYESEEVESRIARFLMGDLRMGLRAIPTEQYLAAYREERRGTWEYRLNLPPDVETELWRVLEEHVREESDIPYDYFHRGCANSIVDLLHEVLPDGTIQYAPWTDKYLNHTRRELVQAALDRAVTSGQLSHSTAEWNAFLLYALIGTDGDKDCTPEQKLIIPSDLVEVWQQATLYGLPLLDSHPITYTEPIECQSHSTRITPTTIALLLLLLTLATWGLCRAPWGRVPVVIIDYMMLIVTSALGCVMTYLIFFSALPCTTWNWLLIPLNPLPLIAWHWRRYWALPYAIILMIWVFAMLLYPHTLVGTAYLILSIGWSILLCRVSKKQHLFA